MKPETVNRTIIWLIICLGITLPWATGISVKLYLQAQGRPTWPWSHFFSPGALVTELWATMWFAAPFLMLAFLAQWILPGKLSYLDRFTDWERRAIVLATLSGGAVGSVRVFLDVFWEFDPMVWFFAFLIPLLYMSDMLIGLAAGICIAVLSLVVRRLQTDGSP